MVPAVGAVLIVDHIASPAITGSEAPSAGQATRLGRARSPASSRAKLNPVSKTANPTRGVPPMEASEVKAPSGWLNPTRPQGNPLKGHAERNDSWAR
jgi:hypothetical protein